MDFLNELESMAQATAQQSQQPDEPDDGDVKRWQSLFGLSHPQALKEIRDHRSDLSRPRVFESHWEMVRSEKEAEGFDKETYEYFSRMKTSKPSAGLTTIQNRTYLLKLESLMESLEMVKLAANLKEDPPVYFGTDDDGNPTAFCKVDLAVKESILAYLSKMKWRFQPTFVPYSMAMKDLSTTSAYPTLGLDALMPQFRPSSIKDHYFFYGTLANSTVLGRLLGVVPLHKDASVQGGILKTWRGKYKAMVDSLGGIVHGSAFLVQDQNQEEILRCYETESYEVVRCELDIKGERVMRLTFRFVGNL
ncbi:hypothetical protein F4680DRAFT_460673 [Xylaria scruposa]|nr:hypothetical protein F4680DRAFT_460673 [Xylaria scruposa]